VYRAVCAFLRGSIMSAITTLSNLLTTGTVQDHELVTLTAKQSKQIQIVREAASIGDLLDVATSKDKALKEIVLSQLANGRMRELLHTYVTTGNASGLVRWVNLQIGTLSIPQMPSKKVELAGYESTINAWVRYNNKGDENTLKMQAIKRNAVAWLAPVFEAIEQMNTVSESQTESLQR